MVPYEDLQDSAAPGFSTEVIRAVLESMKMDYTFSSYPWARSLQMVYSGDVDALYSAFWSAERAQKCLFPREPLIHGEWVFFIRKADVGLLKFNSYDDLIGKRIGALNGAAISPEFWAFAKTHHTVELGTFDEQNFKKLG
jgi:polar amino acid transport system substrate-binding protein